MGMDPITVGNLSLWEFNACLDGFNQANGGKKAAPEISDETLRDMGIEGF